MKLLMTGLIRVLAHGRVYDVECRLPAVMPLSGR